MKIAVEPPGCEVEVDDDEVMEERRRRIHPLPGDHIAHLETSTIAQARMAPKVMLRLLRGSGPRDTSAKAQ